MKRIIALVLVALSVSVLGGCNKKAENPNVSTPDATTSASPKETSDPEAVVKGLSADGYWILSLLSDVTVDKEIAVDGTFHDKDDSAGKVFRKLALYAQDSDRNVTAEYTLTVPKMTVTSPNFRIQNGTVKGDVYVNAEGFELSGTTIDGNLVFASQELMDAALLEDGTVTGSVSVG